MRAFVQVIETTEPLSRGHAQNTLDGRSRTFGSCAIQVFPVNSD